MFRWRGEFTFDVPTILVGRSATSVPLGLRLAQSGEPLDLILLEDLDPMLQPGVGGERIGSRHTADGLVEIYRLEQAPDTRWCTRVIAVTEWSSSVAYGPMQDTEPRRDQLMAEAAARKKHIQEEVTRFVVQARAVSGQIQAAGRQVTERRTMVTEVGTGIWRTSQLFSQSVGPIAAAATALSEERARKVAAGADDLLSEKLLERSLQLDAERALGFDTRYSMLLTTLSLESRIRSAVDEADPETAGKIEHWRQTAKKRGFAQYLHQPMDLLCGHSLQREEQGLYEAIVRVFEVRGTSAHDPSVTVAHADAKEAIQTVGRVHEWLSDCGIP